MDGQIDRQNRWLSRQIDQIDRLDRQIDRYIDREQVLQQSSTVDVAAWLERHQRKRREEIGREVGRQVASQRKSKQEREKERKRGDLNHLSAHQWLRSAIRDSQQPTSPIGVLFLKLPPPPCAVLLVLGSALYRFYNTKFWEVLCTNFVELRNTKQYQDIHFASFVVQSNTGTCVMQVLQYKVVLGSIL